MEELLPSIPDLLNCNDLPKLSFRCQLASELLRKYPDASSRVVLKSIISKLKLIYDTERSQNLDKFLGNEVVNFFISVLPSIGSVSVTFCDVAEEVVQLLLKLRMQLSHQTSDTLSPNPLLPNLEAVVQNVFAQLVRQTP
ncbi:hypothetical protein THRCLA_08176 [Thraustotheca clavata]|uniref:Uncharacterized protein n=1 Tax=Thraustotheca clavata TaxID=74557 RepID=A0A1V9Z8Y1_9STRA|nr:hypothetical protein THRCLA_08176 [Thraustotheca clavata]